MMTKTIYDAKTDPTYQNPVVDRIWEDDRKTLTKDTVHVTYVHGHFEKTNVKFLFVFPGKSSLRGVFFQHLSPFPGPDEELAQIPKTGEDDMISFCALHGITYVESNMGSTAVFGSEKDATIFYKSNAAVAEYCRQVFREKFGVERAIGICFGGSGGGYKAMSCIENTNAFDGAVPFVIGSPASLPNVLTVCAHGARLLRHCADKISASFEPDGNQNPYESLNEEEAACLTEITKMGFPPFLSASLEMGSDGSLPVLMPVVQALDPTYFTDFWTKPGYLGTEKNSNAVRDRIHFRTTVRSVYSAGRKKENAGIDDRNGTDTAWQKMLSQNVSAGIEVQDVPTGEDLYLMGTEIRFLTGKAAGKKLRLSSIEGKILVPGPTFGVADNDDVLSLVEKGDEILIDNSDYIAVQTYHRHQIPDASFHAFDQYKDGHGNPIYPQRAQVISYGFTAGGCGSVQDGQIQGKVMVINNLSDGDFPWQADWYRRKVHEAIGDRDQDMFRLYYNENAPHGDAAEVGDDGHLVSYLGMLRQALLDMADWIQKGKRPQNTTGYELVDSQVIPAKDPAKRFGLQPMITAYADGKRCTKGKAGTSVRITAQIELPAGTGDTGRVLFSFDNGKTFADRVEILQVMRKNGYGCVRAEDEHVFTAPGKYYVVCRVEAKRKGADDYTLLRNLSRACVIVE